jgi:hypothetical protein
MSGTQSTPGQSTTDPCPCGTVAFPQATCNLPNLPAIAYRIGDFVAFRYQLLRALPGETELTVWRPNAPGDLAVQMMEWWAYLADILTFYNERIANEAYLDTALLPESVNHLVQLLGYRPKPALGAKGTLAALLTPTAQLPLTLPAGLQIQSKPGPGQSPQIFQLDQATTVQAPDVVATNVNVSSALLLPADGSSYVWLAGKVTGMKPGDRLLLANMQWLTAQTAADYAWINVTGTQATSDPLGNPVTQVNFTTVAGAITGGTTPPAQAANYTLLRSSQSSPPWGYTTTATVISATSIDLASVARGVTPGSLLLLDVSNASTAAITAAATAAAATIAAVAFDAAFLAASAALLVAGNIAAAISSAAAAAATTAAASATTAAAAATAATAAAATAAAGAVAAATSAGEAADPTVLNVPLVPYASVAAAATAAAPAAQAAITAATAAIATAATTAASEATADFVATPVIVQSYAEVVWYANGDGPTPPPGSTANPSTPVAMPHAHIGFANLPDPGAWNENASKVTARWGWTPVGSLVPVLTAADLTYTGGNTVLVPAPGAASFPTLPTAVMLQDPTGNGAAATAIAAATPAAGATLSNITPLPPPPLSLASPIDMFFNMLGVSRGKAVPSEVLGSGNPSVAGQDFTLAQSPVTYFFDTASISGNNFSSTVQVSVNGVQWQEVQSFYGQTPNAQVFVLHEDDQGQTRVTFGDGVNGALLPTGTNNIVATYRYGAGSAAPPAGTLTVVLTPTPGLKGVSNPLPPTGGGDADQPAQLQSLAPQSVLTFNRAVSLDDYAAIALTASGVTQAVASYAFDPLAQRPVVTLWIAGDSGAAAAVTAALAGTAVPNQGLRIYQATAVPATLSLTYVRDTRYGDAAVQSGLTTALLDPNVGLLGTNMVGIGQTIYQSQIAAACLAVPGVTAIQDVVLADINGITFLPLRFNLLRRFIPLSPATACSGQSYNPGAGQYFSIPNDGQHLFLTGTTAS